MAGVSAGTVDRVLHNRGEVSQSSREKVEAILTEIDYKPNLYVSSIGVKRVISIVVVLPSFSAGGYWEQIEKGIRHAVYEFSNIRLKVKYLYYDQFDLFSCREIYNKALTISCDAMLIGPTFTDETMQFVCRLEAQGIPYVFVDSMILNTNPLAFYGPDSYTLGRIQARLLTESMDKGCASSIPRCVWWTGHMMRRVPNRAVRRSTNCSGSIPISVESPCSIRVHMLFPIICDDMACGVSIWSATA